MAYRLKYTDSSEFTGMLVNTRMLGGQQNITLLAAQLSQVARVLEINMNLNQNQEISEDFTEEKNFLASLNANHIDAYAIRSEPFQRTNLEFRPEKLKYPKPEKLPHPVVLQTNPTLFPVKNIPYQAYFHIHGGETLRMLLL